MPHFSITNVRVGLRFEENAIFSSSQQGGGGGGTPIYSCSLDLASNIMTSSDDIRWSYDISQSTQSIPSVFSHVVSFCFILLRKKN